MYFHSENQPKLSAKEPNQPLLLTNCRVVTDTPPATLQHDSVILLKDGKIAFVGYERLLGGIKATRLDLAGTVVTPGLCDAHMHLAAGGQALSIPDLTKLDRDAVEILLKRAATDLRDDPTAWVEAFNWDEDFCHLDADILEAWVPNRMVVVHKRDLHGCCCNRTALSRTGIDRLHGDPDGGKIGRAGDNRPNGMLYEHAVGILLHARPPVTSTTKRGFILAAQKYLTSLGVTAVGEVLDAGNAEHYMELDASGDLKIEVDGWQRIEHWDGTPPKITGNRFNVNTLKLFLDGSFGSKTAALYEPFSDTGDDSGMLLYSDEQLSELFTKAVKAGWRLAIHAIGDRAAEQACRVLAKTPKPIKGLNRIEHLQLLPKTGCDCVAASGAAASIQPVHLLDDQVWLPARIGADRCLRSFVWRSLLDRGVEIAIGSDWPVASPDPLLNIHTAINRAPFSGTAHPMFDQREALAPMEAIRTASWGYAVVTGTSDRRGSVAAGYDADLTVISGLDDDLRDWSKAKTVLTITGGEVVFDLSTN